MCQYEGMNHKREKSTIVKQDVRCTACNTYARKCFLYIVTTIGMKQYAVTIDDI